MKRLFKSIITIASLVILTTSPAMALNTVSPNGITVSPAIENLIVAPDQNSVSFTSEVTNNTTQPVNIMLNVNDFASLGQNGGISFYGSNYSSKANPHGLAYWLHPNIYQFGLNPGKSQSVIATIGSLNLMARGGHYGALIYDIGAITATGTRSQIDNNPVVSTLIFLSTAGQGTQTLHLSQPLTSSLYIHPPQSIQFVLANIGNTQTTPRGYITEDKGSKEISRGIINSGSGLVLPGSARLFSVNLKTETSDFWGGSYRLIIHYRPDSATFYFNYYKTFYVIGPAWFWLLGIVMILIGVILYRRKSRHIYKL
jgi:hypothetical protein